MSRPDSGKLSDGVHRLAVRVYVGDTDAGGMVYHANYLKFLERGRSEFLRTLDIDHSALISPNDDPMVFAVTRLEIDYRRQAKVDDALIVETSVLRIRPASFDVAQRVMRGDETVADATVRVAILDKTGPRAGLPARIPADMKKKFSGLA